MAILAGLRDGDAALLYACLASSQQSLFPAQAAAALDFTPERMKKATELLCVYGLIAKNTAPPPREEPSYPGETLAAVRENDPVFSGLCSYFEAAAGRILNRRELETLLSVRETLCLPPDVMALLIGDCAQRHRLTAREVERVAYQWYDLGLDQYEKACAYLRQRQERATQGAKVLELFGIHNRLPGETEQKYIDQWMQMGISEDLLRLAYDRTLLGAGKLSWPYLNKILLSWQKKGVRTAEDAKQEQKGSFRPAEPVETHPESAETVILRRMQQRRQQRALVLEERRKALRESSPEFAENESSLRLCASRMARASGEKRQALEEDYRTFLSRQSALLRALGKPQDWLTDRPDCPLCGDRGYIGSQRCSCLSQALQKETSSF